MKPQEALQTDRVRWGSITCRLHYPTPFGLLESLVNEANCDTAWLNVRCQYFLMLLSINRETVVLKFTNGTPCRNASIYTLILYNIYWRHKQYRYVYKMNASLWLSSVSTVNDL